jgi:hypothetical protein
MAGIYVVTQGNIVLTDISTYANGVTYRTDGAYLNNCSGVGTVTVSNSEFLSNGSVGLNIMSLKNVSLNGITANDNLSFGVYIDNRGYDGSSSYLGNGTVSITGKDWNTFNGNAYYGLSIYSNGNVTLANFTANDNLNGVFIENGYAGKTGRVTINQTYTSDLEDYTNTISGNTTNGLEIYSNGAISIDSLNVYDNRGFGIKLDNSNASKPATVDVRDSSFMAMLTVWKYGRPAALIFTVSIPMGIQPMGCISLQILGPARLRSHRHVPEPIVSTTMVTMAY